MAPRTGVRLGDRVVEPVSALRGTLADLVIEHTLVEHTFVGPDRAPGTPGNDDRENSLWDYRDSVGGQRDSSDSGTVDLARTEAKLLATVLELALVVAQTGMKVVPPFEAPAPLRPFLQFTAKIPGPALRAARRVLDDDALFRARVASVATEELVGRAGSLYVRRPEGWEADFQQAVLDAMGDASHEGTAKRVGRLEKKVVGLESVLVRTESELARIRTELALSQGLLAEERRARAAVAAELARLRSSVDEAATSEQRARIDARTARLSATALLAERDAARLRAEAAEDALRKRASFDAAVARTLSALDDLGGELRLITSTGSGMKSAGERSIRSAAVSSSPSSSSPSPSPSSSPSVSPLSSPSVSPLSSSSSSASSSPSVSGTAPAQKMAKPPRVAAARRRPIPLPPGIFEDSVDAALALFRSPDVVVLVDAYNVAKWRWPEAGARDLRARLVAMAGQISHRTGAAIHLIFDGAHEGGVAKPGGSAKVRIVYTPVGVEADDVILEMASQAPNTLPIVVVSNDMRVVAGAMAIGVNVVPSHAFVASSGSA